MLTLAPQAPATRPVARRAPIRAVPNNFSSSLSLVPRGIVCSHPRHPLLARAASAGGGAGAGAGAGAGDTEAAGEEARGTEARAKNGQEDPPASCSDPSAVASSPLPLPPNNRRCDDDDDAAADRGGGGTEAVVEAVKSLGGGHGVSVILLRLLDGTSRLLPIYVGEFEATSLARGLAAAQLGGPLPSPASPSSSLASASSSAAAAAASRPQTYDLLGSTIAALGRAVSHVSVVDLRHNTYYACVSLVPAEQQGGVGGGGAEDAGGGGKMAAIELDARPSDALNLAVRCGCAVYVSRDVAERCALPEQLLPPELQTEPPLSPLSPQSSSASSALARHARSPSPSPAGAGLPSALLPHHRHQHPSHTQGQGGQQQHPQQPPPAQQRPQPPQESHADIVRTARAAVLAYRDPTPMLALARDVAAAQERFEAAAQAQAALAGCVTRDGALRLAAAVEAALADGRYGEAARLRDELLRAVGEQEAHARELGAGGGPAGGGDLDMAGGALP